MVNSVVVVLGAALQADATPSPALRRRVETGCRLAQETDADLLMCGGLTRQDIAVSEAAVMAQLAGELGCAPDRIVLEDQSKNTLENAFYASELIKRKGWERVTIVTQRYHVFRAALLFKMFDVTVTYRVAPAGKMSWLLFFSYLREVPALLWNGVRVLNGHCQKLTNQK